MESSVPTSPTSALVTTTRSRSRFVVTMSSIITKAISKVNPRYNHSHTNSHTSNGSNHSTAGGVAITLVSDSTSEGRVVRNTSTDADVDAPSSPSRHTRSPSFAAEQKRRRKAEREQKEKAEAEARARRAKEAYENASQVHALRSLNYTDVDIILSRIICATTMAICL